MNQLSETAFRTSTLPTLAMVASADEPLLVASAGDDSLVLVAEREYRRLGQVIDTLWLAAADRPGPPQADDQPRRRIPESRLTAELDEMLAHARQHDDVLIERMDGANVVMLSEPSFGGFQTTIELLRDSSAARSLLASMAELDRVGDQHGLAAE